MVLSQYILIGVSRAFNISMGVWFIKQVWLPTDSENEWLKKIFALTLPTAGRVNKVVKQIS